MAFAGDGVVAGLAEALALLPEDAVDGWTLAGWFRTTDPELGGSPYDVLVDTSSDMTNGHGRAESRCSVLQERAPRRTVNVGHWTFEL